MRDATWAEQKNTPELGLGTSQDMAPTHRTIHRSFVQQIVRALDYSCNKSFVHWIVRATERARGALFVWRIAGNFRSRPYAGTLFSAGNKRTIHLVA
jgi:hypothetical protein